MAQEHESHAWWPMSERDLIPDAETALLTGIAILNRYYGQKTVARFEPYTATLRSGQWHVSGDSPAAKAARLEQDRLGPEYHVSVLGGGQPYIRMSARDARVETIALSW